MRILLPLDGSSFSDVAVNEVVSRPWPAPSEVKIVTAAVVAHAKCSVEVVHIRPHEKEAKAA